MNPAIILILHQRSVFQFVHNILKQIMMFEFIFFLFYMCRYINALFPIVFNISLLQVFFLFWFIAFFIKIKGCGSYCYAYLDRCYHSCPLNTHIVFFLILAFLFFFLFFFLLLNLGFIIRIQKMFDWCLWKSHTNINRCFNFCSMYYAGRWYY
jgi:hypothetical protein